tara:strand:+ start:976 stop:1452 length:477 start_codon:yes stop_codon:yes gene_type:complete
MIFAGVSFSREFNNNLDEEKVLDYALRCYALFVVMIDVAKIENDKEFFEMNTDNAKDFLFISNVFYERLFPNNKELEKEIYFNKKGLPFIEHFSNSVNKIRKEEGPVLRSKSFTKEFHGKGLSCFSFSETFYTEWFPELEMNFIPKNQKFSKFLIAYA